MATGRHGKRKRARPPRRQAPRAGGERIYYVNGMHCPACEIIMEKKLIALDGVHAVEASTSRSTVLIECDGQPPTASQLNEHFKPEGYSFALEPQGRSGGSRTAAFSRIAVAGVVAVGLLVVLQKAGLTTLVTVNSKSSLPAFLLLGLVAGLSSCAALIGGVVLSMAKQWGEIYSPDDPLKKRLEPHLLFNSGRLASFVIFGAVLALIGGSLRLTPSFSGTLIIVISIVMIALGLQMLGVRSLQRFGLTMPRAITRYVADEGNFKGRHMPLAMGALTFFLPCGFAMTAQSFALLSGNAVQGGLIMLFFALGTLPMLLLIGFSSVKFLEKPRLANSFLKVAGVIVLFFALFNINNQLVILNAPNLGDLLNSGSAADNASTLQGAPLVNGKQVLKMEAGPSGYTPSSFTVKAGVPVRWEITDVGTSGCTNAIISQNLFSGEIALTPGRVSTKEFTPKKPGKYTFSCWMGMVTGTINVVAGKSGKPEAGAPEAPATDGGPGRTAPPPSVKSQASPAPARSSNSLPEMVDGKQVLKMEASSTGFNPDKLRVRVGVPVRWEIKDVGTSGCTNAVKADTLFPGKIQLTHGETSYREFTPTRVGRYRFSCWMGMVTGVIDVVDPEDPDRKKFEYDESTGPGPGGCPCCGG